MSISLLVAVSSVRARPTLVCLPPQWTSSPLTVGLDLRLLVACCLIAYMLERVDV